MKTTLAEKKLFVALFCAAIAVALFANASLITVPVYISEKAIAMCLAASALFVFGARLFKQAIVKK